MKKILLVLLGLIIINPAQLIAGDKEDIIKQLLANNAYAKKNNQTADEYSANGALEFWSSGGLMQKIEPAGRPDKYDYMKIDFKHIEVIVLVPKNNSWVINLKSFKVACCVLCPNKYFRRSHQFI